MTKVYVSIPEDRMRILKKKKDWVERIEEYGNVRISLNEHVEIEGEDPLNVMRVQNVIKALGRGFSLNEALYLLDDEYRLEIIDVKFFAGRSRARERELKGRVIGTKGKMKRIIENFTGTKIAIYGKTVSIIGRWRDVEIARQAVEMILKGAQHQSVHRFLERHRI